MERLTERDAEQEDEECDPDPDAPADQLLAASSSAPLTALDR